MALSTAVGALAAGTIHFSGYGQPPDELAYLTVVLAAFQGFVMVILTLQNRPLADKIVYSLIPLLGFIAICFASHAGSAASHAVELAAATFGISLVLDRLSRSSLIQKLANGSPAAEESTESMTKAAGSEPSTTELPHQGPSLGSAALILIITIVRSRG